MKCCTCAAIGMNTITDYIYAGYSLCVYHVRMYNKMVEKYQKDSRKKREKRIGIQ